MAGRGAEGKQGLGPAPSLSPTPVPRYGLIGGDAFLYAGLTFSFYFLQRARIGGRKNMTLLRLKNRLIFFFFYLTGFWA